MHYHPTLATALLIIAFTLISCGNDSSPDYLEFPNAPSDLKINQIQVLGTHNSYARAIDPKVLTMMDSLMEQLGDLTRFMDSAEQAEYREYHPHDVKLSEALSYTHPPLVAQLDSGIRNLEIDIYHDPTGERFNKPAAYQLLKTRGERDLLPFDSLGLSLPGFKVFHMPDVDFRSHHTHLSSALMTLKAWSDWHPGHVPIFILVELKHAGMPLLPGAAQVLPFDSLAFEQLEKAFLDYLGRDKIITPDDVRGDHSRLEDAVLAHHWPLLKDARGKFLFLCITALESEQMDPYLVGHPSLEGRLMFVRSTPGQDHAAFLLLDNAQMRKKEIQNLVRKGYLVRTRSDIDTYEAMQEDYRMAKAAFVSGAQIVSTDYFQVGNAYQTNFVVRLPGDEPARISPVFETAK